MNRNDFSCRRNSPMSLSGWRIMAGRLFQSHGPAAAKLHMAILSRYFLYLLKGSGTDTLITHLLLEIRPQVRVTKFQGHNGRGTSGHSSIKDKQLKYRVYTVPNKFSVPKELTFIAAKSLYPMNRLILTE